MNRIGVDDLIIESICNEFFKLNRELFAEEELDEAGNIIYQPSPLHEVWLDEAGRRQGNEDRIRQRRRNDDLIRERNRAVQRVITAATQTSIRDVFRMMEVKSRKVWICLAKGSTGKYTGYFSSVVESINDHVKNFVACLGAQVYWWLRRRGCLAEDVNRMIRHCFTLDQQQKITKSKYMPNKGYAVLHESNSDDIINAVEEEGIYDTTLGLSERERRSAIAGRGYDASEIMFGEAKEGAMEAHNFSSSMSVTTIHSKNVNDTPSVASQKTLAKSVYSLDTSKVTSDG